MQFSNKKIFKILVVFIFFLFAAFPVYANDKINEIDLIRAELSYIKDKNSQQYIKAKQKLDKIIEKNKIDYTDSARIVDIQRLIQEHKFNSAVWELNELIEKGYQLSLCFELLGDVSYKASKPAKYVANNYKTSLQYDKDNTSAMLKLAKLYLKEKKNIIAIEYLKQIVQTSNDAELLAQIEDIISNKIMPKDRYEANNLYETLGNIYEKTDRKKDAYEAYAKALQLNQNDIYLRYHFADLLFSDNQNKDAITLYDSILYLNPQDVQIKTSIAKAFMKDGNFVTAQKYFYEILKKFPNSMQAKYGLYKLYESKFPPDKILEKIYFNNPNFKTTPKELKDFALFLADMGDIEAARNFEKCAFQIEEVEKQKILAQKEVEEREKFRLEQEKIKLEQQKELKKQKQLQEQKKILEEKKLKEKLAKEKSEQERLAKEKLQKEKQIKEQQLLKAKKEKEEAIEKEKIKQAKIKKEQERIALEKKAIELERQKAIAANAKKYQELKIIVDKYLATNPKTTDIYIAIANTYKQMGEQTSALKYLNEAKKSDPTNSEIYYNIGLLQFEMNKLNDSKASLDKSINLEDENTKAKNLLAFVNQRIVTKTINDAYVKFEKKEYIDAFSILEKGLKEYPKNAQLYFYRALVYDEMNRNAAAIYDLQKAIELDPAHYMAYYHLGKVYEKIKDERNALVAYERFLSIEPEEAELIKEIEQKVVALGAKYY